MIRSDDTLVRVVFIVGMTMLGIAAAIVLLRHPEFFSRPAPPAGHHHTIDSPYSQHRFQAGQPQAQTNIGAGHAHPKLLAGAYRTAGYEWLALSDVNSVTPVTTYTVPGLEPVLGADVTYSYAHFMALGIDHIEMAVTPQAAVDWMHADAGAAFLARPLQAPSLDYATIAALRGLDGIQIYDARLDHDEPSHADATALWDRLLSDGHIAWGIVGDDTLDDRGPTSTLGRTSVDIQVQDLASPFIIDALRRGAFVDSAGVRILSVSVSGDTITVVTTNADSIQFIGSGGAVRRTTEGTRGEYRVDWSEGYIRAYASNRAGGRAWIQPLVVNP